MGQTLSLVQLFGGVLMGGMSLWYVDCVEYCVALKKQRGRAEGIVRGMSSSVYTGLAR